MDAQIRRELRILKGYALVATALLATLSLAAFQQAGQKTRFTEIDVERINVVEPDGKLRLVIANRPRSIGPIYKGQPFGYPGGSRPGMIIFNDEGTENGGFTFEGRRNPDGTFSAGTHLSFDQFNQDQIMVLAYNDRNGTRQTGLTISDRADVDIFDMVKARDSIVAAHPEGPARDSALRRWAAPRNGVPLYAERVYVGRNRAKASAVSLSDPQGRTRLRLVVDSLGAASIEFLDERGTVTSRLPGTGR